MTMIDDSNMITATEDEQTALKQLNQTLNQSNGYHIKITTLDGQEIELPSSLVQGLQQLAQHLSQGKTVTVISSDEEISSERAADILNVPHSYLITLLEKAEIPSRGSDTQRFIRLDNLIGYKQNRDNLRRKGLTEMLQVNQQVEGYN